MANIRSKIAPVALAALFAVTTATSVIARQAAHPAAGSNDGAFAGTAQPAGAEGYGYHHGGRYRWHGRYYGHRRWRPGYWQAGHVWHPGVWIYF